MLVWLLLDLLSLNRGYFLPVLVRLLLKTHTLICAPYLRLSCTSHMVILMFRIQANLTPLRSIHVLTTSTRLRIIETKMIRKLLFDLKLM